MSLVLKRVKAYLKIIVLVGLAIVVGLIVWKNRQNEVNVWFFHAYEQINVLWLILCTGVASVIAWWLVAASVGVWRDLKELHRADEIKRRDQDQKQLAGKLAETEKRLDDKLKQTETKDSVEKQQQNE